jgi:hypothetical protein
MPLVIVKLFPDNAVLGFTNFNNGEAFLIEYTIYALIFLILFSIGFFIKFKLNNLINNKPQLSSLFLILLMGAYFFLFWSIFSLSEVLNMPGYLDGYDIERRGQLSTLFLTSIWWYIYIQSSVKLKPSKILFIFIILLSGLNLLALGSRLAVLTGVIMLFLNYKSRLFVKFKVNIFSAIIWILITVSVFGAIGVLREANEISYEAIAFIIFAEPVFIFASVFSYFNSVPISLINVPYDVFSSLAASIPSLIFQNKIEFFAKYASIPEFAQSGFGGANQIIILLANFGVLLFPFVSFIMGYFIASMINKMNRSRFSYTAAIGIVALIPFIFFRDGYQTSLKLALMNFLIMPAIFLLINRIIVLSKNANSN